MIEEASKESERASLQSFFFFPFLVFVFGFFFVFFAL